MEGSDMGQNTRTGSGNNSHTRQTQFRELYFVTFLRNIVPPCILVPIYSDTLMTLFTLMCRVSV